VKIEPSDQSLQEAIDVATRERSEGFVAVDGGSKIDTAKTANPKNLGQKKSV
jgi:alcohol dehydrogenase class IV